MVSALNATPQSAERSDDSFAAAYMADCRGLVLKELRAIVPTNPRFKSILYDLMLDYPERSAKALRPALCIATCRALGGPLGGVLQSAAVLELYHNAFLIHDDIEDGSEKRREGNTLHRNEGVAIALNVGDAMLALALQPLFDNMRLLGLGKALRILNAVAEMARHTAEGQALELSWIRDETWELDDLDYLRMVQRKTTWYTFITPVVVGALVAGASEPEITQLRLFATALGSAFQIQDDVLNLSAEEERYGKEINGDLWEGKRTLILLHALRAASERDRARALGILRKPRPALDAPADSELARELAALRQAGELTELAYERLSRATFDGNGSARHKTEEDVSFLRQLIEDHRSLEHARAVAQRRATKARKCLDSMHRFMPASPHRDFLDSLVAFVVVRDR
jgi:geranylgeranyl diphosphate synthase, type II